MLTKMARFILSRPQGQALFVTPMGPADDLGDALHDTLSAYAGGWDTRMRLLEGLLNFEMVEGEDWRDALLEDYENARERARCWGAEVAGLVATPDKNPNWRTWNVDRETGPVEHYMLAFSTARIFFAQLIKMEIRPKKSQNPFERDLWHLETEDSRWLYCVRRYGEKAAYVYPHAGAFFLPGERRPYHRSLFNPAGIGRRMAEAVRERSGDHYATNMIEVMCDDPGRFDDIRECNGSDWPDLGDIIYARNKGGGDEHNKPLVITDATREAMFRRIDRDHLADPEGRLSVAQLKAMWAAGDEASLKKFYLFQKSPERGDGPPAYNSFWEIVHKACRANGVTVGRGSAERTASSRWPRREKVDRRMLQAHRDAKSTADLEKSKDDIRIELGWKTDQTGNYGSFAEQQVATERKREQNRVDEERQQAEARGERVHDRPMSDAARAASQHAMRRPTA